MTSQEWVRHGFLIEERKGAMGCRRSHPRRSAFTPRKSYIDLLSYPEH
ncbi:hypothetical protein TcasGA2_TC031440 [Tribolium castaneum]|uniref:Uncharacterized protein n=1 Tax=Tribolium castaneum TaxID=7070 RepID=A0A139WAK5_TRICA|nr:hypothetical protein TcasGA2_TC031440 [Tribolium castaneum]